MRPFSPFFCFHFPVVFVRFIGLARISLPPRSEFAVPGKGGVPADRFAPKLLIFCIFKCVFAVWATRMGSGFS